MILEPNRYFSEAYEHDMAGMLLVTEGTGFRVRQLIENSPATAAGLHEGDVISAINGKPASALTLEQLRLMFMREGRSYLLSIKRGEQQIEITIKMRRLI